MLTRLLFIGCLFSCRLLMAQAVLKGTVTDKETGKPLPGASVFMSNTSFGTATKEDGSFILQQLPAGKYDMVVSAIGYETVVLSVQTAAIKIPQPIALQPKAHELEAVVLEPYEKNGWEKWGKFFLENFIGTSALAADCKLKNYQVIHFRNSKARNELTAIANEPLIIENKALGYVIQYQLEQFTYRFRERYLLYTGYPLFKSMDGRPAKQRRWYKNREEVYYGSVMHFMRSVYRNRLQEEKFLVYRLKKQPNLEKKRVKQLYASGAVQQHRNNTGRGTDMRAIVMQPGGGVAVPGADSSDYYSRVLRQPDEINLLSAQPLPGDSIAYAIDATTAGMDFPDYLQVVYTGKEEPVLYLQQTMQGGKPGYITSQITLLNKRPLEIYSNGVYYNPTDLLSSGYWGWSEKIAHMLPFDYKPMRSTK
jgi:hypothetical protein